MRIVGGKYARQRLIAPPGAAVRPTSDRVREALFNILQHHDWGGGRDVIDGARVLDACCGTGALALEAISRGAEAAWLMDKSAAALKAARQNAETLDCTDQCHFMQNDAASPPRAAAPCNLIFVDPPYRQNLPQQIIPALMQAGWIAPQAMLIIETARKETLVLPEEFAPRLQRDYGDTRIWFYTTATHTPQTG